MFRYVSQTRQLTKSITRKQNIYDIQINITSTKLVTEKGHL